MNAQDTPQTKPNNVRVEDLDTQQDPRGGPIQLENTMISSYSLSGTGGYSLQRPAEFKSLNF